jgi:hypothetical protein
MMGQERSDHQKLEEVQQYHTENKGTARNTGLQERKSDVFHTSSRMAKTITQTYRAVY